MTLNTHKHHPTKRRRQRPNQKTKRRGRRLKQKTKRGRTQKRRRKQRGGDTIRQKIQQLPSALKRAPHYYSPNCMSTNNNITPADINTFAILQLLNTPTLTSTPTPTPTPNLQTLNEADIDEINTTALKKYTNELSKYDANEQTRELQKVLGLIKNPVYVAKLLEMMPAGDVKNNIKKWLVQVSVRDPATPQEQVPEPTQRPTPQEQVPEPTQTQAQAVQLKQTEIQKTNKNLCSKYNNTTQNPTTRETLKDGNCFYSSLYRAARDSPYGDLRQYILSCLTDNIQQVPVNDEAEYIKLVRKAVADKIQKNVYNAISNKRKFEIRNDKTIRDRDLQAALEVDLYTKLYRSATDPSDNSLYTSWMDSASNQMKTKFTKDYFKTSTSEQFYNDLANIVKTDKVYASDSDISVVDYLLGKCKVIIFKGDTDDSFKKRLAKICDTPDLQKKIHLFFKLSKNTEHYDYWV